MSSKKPFFIKHKTALVWSYDDDRLFNGWLSCYEFSSSTPDVFNKVIALSGVYDARYFLVIMGTMRLFIRTFQLTIFGIKMMAGLLMLSTKVAIIVCTGHGAGRRMDCHLFTLWKELLIINRFPACLLSGAKDGLMISLVCKQCHILLTTQPLMEVIYEL